MEDILRGLLHLSLSVVDIEKRFGLKISEIQNNLDLLSQNNRTLTQVVNTLLESENAKNEKGKEDLPVDGQGIREEKG